MLPLAAHRLGLAWVAILTLPLRGAVPVPHSSDPVVMLPPMVVEDKLRPLPWRYAALPKLEVLSICDDDVSTNFVRHYLELEQLLGLIVPEQFQVHETTPDVLILFSDDELNRARSPEVIAEMLGRGHQAAGGEGGWRQPVFLPNLRMTDVDSSAMFAAIQESRRLDFTLTTDRIAFLVERRSPALPPWLIAGVIGWYAQVELRDNTVKVNPATWYPRAAADALEGDPAAPRTLWPMGDLLRQFRPDADSTSQMTALWRAQCALFIRWALTEDGGAHRGELWRFVDRLQREPLTEALFRECFGMGFADMRDRLSDYLSRAVGDSRELRLDKFAPLPEIRFHPASDVDIGRIRGDWERLEIAYVRGRFPELLNKYVEQARRTVRLPYDRGSRDPRLLAVIGLTEVEAGNPTGAREFLEKAVAGGVERPRVWFELAKLRYDAATLGLKTAMLDPDEAESVLSLLRRSIAWQPPLAESAALMAEVLTRSRNPPRSSDLALLNSLVIQLPQVAPVVMRTIYLDAVNGQLESARSLAHLGRNHAVDLPTQQRFDRIIAEIGQLAVPARNK